MLIYHYDAEGFYTHSSELDDSDRDPFNPGVFLIPANATPARPPEPMEHQIARWMGEAWALVPDYVGVSYYVGDQAQVMSVRGVELPDGATLEKPQSLLDKELQAAKFDAINLIEQKANEFHALVVGTADKSREARFALNLELAQKLLAGTASAIEQQALQMQLDANQQANHPILTGKTLEQFAQWIVQYKDFSTLGSGLIESTLIKGRAAINAAQSIEEIEQIKLQLAAQAQAAFEQLRARLSS